MIDSVALIIDGQRYEGWSEVAIHRSMESEAASFELSVSERWGDMDQPWPILPGSQCRVEIDGEPVITGFVDSYAPSTGPEEHAVRVSGASATADLVDCSAVVPGGQYRGYDLAAVTRALCAPFGIAATFLDPVGAAFPDVQVTPGESVVEVLGRLAAQRGLLVWDDAMGGLVIGRSGSGRAAEALVQGENILKASANLSHAGRHSTYIVRTQQPGSDEVFGTAASQVEARVQDYGIKRYRPLLIAAEGSSDAAGAELRAQWQRAARIGRGTSASVTVQGWHQAGGALWKVNETALLRSPWLGVDRELMIVSVEYRKSINEGTVAVLELMPPEALTPEPVRGDAGSSEGKALWDYVPIEDRP